jgi:CheY-like chemotaxis protein
MANPEPVTIVIIEDDAGHARLIEKNIRRCNITNNVLILTDGRQASDYLFCEGQYVDCTHPNPLMVLLDLKLPKVHGLQILERMKAARRTRSTPVVVLTSTDDKREVDRCYELGCNVFITKPLDYEQFSEAIRKLGLFLSVVTLPGEDEDR